MPDLVIFTGLQGAGKTTLFQARFAATHAHVSKDLIKSSPKDRRQAQLITAAITSGRSVVVDNTSPSVTVRAPLVSLGRELGARVVSMFFPPDLASCLARNRLREGKARVPEMVLAMTLRKLQPPTWEEGFDELHLVVPGSPTGSFAITPLTRIQEG
jgi:predicted kinase